MEKKIAELRGAIYSNYPSEAACARELGWPRQRLSKITNGEKEPNIEEIVSLARVLGKTVEDVVQIFLRHKSPNEQQSA